MRNSRPTMLSSLFKRHNTLYSIQQHAITLAKLDRTVQALLPMILRPWCRVANFRQGILILEAANANWLMRLRYEQTNLLSTLRSDILPSLVSINIKINPTLMVKGAQQGKKDINSEDDTVQKRYLSPDSKRFIQAIAAKSDGKLKEKLEQLATHSPTINE